jgi:hypothetical protein
MSISVYSVAETWGQFNTYSLNAQLSDSYGWKYQIGPHGRLSTRSLGISTLSLMFGSVVYHHGHRLHP